MTGTYTTAQVAKALNIGQRTLLRWLHAGEVPEPQKITVGHDKRAWTDADLENLRRYKEKNYAKRR